MSICWDGKGGSTKRRLMNKNYKNGRKPLRLNRNVQLLDENQELKNKIWQMTRLAEYLNNMPVIQLLLDSVEADDLISVIVQHATIQKYNKIIVSNDKDFIQLCNDDTILYRPVKEEVLNTNRIIEQYGIHPSNFCLVRAISGDKSDNIDGVQGAGIPTIAKKGGPLAGLLTKVNTWAPKVLEPLSGMEFNGIDDIEYLRNKMLAALKIPKAFLGYEEDLSGKATLASEDVRFAKTVNRVQRILISELNKIAMVHLYAQGYKDASLVDFTLELTNPSVMTFSSNVISLLLSRYTLSGFTCLNASYLP